MKIETEILRGLRMSGVNLGPSQIAGKFDGYSEAWIEKEFPVASIQELIRLFGDVNDETRAQLQDKRSFVTT